MTANNNYSLQENQTLALPAFYESAGNRVDTETIVWMIKSKNERGFHTLYDQYCGALYGILIKFVKQTDIADDLLQDVFVKIWKNIDFFDSAKGTLFTWMLNIARNSAIDYLRSSRHQQQALHVDNELFAKSVGFIDTAEPISNSTEFKDMQKIARKLDSKYAEVIDMIFFYGCTHEQTARLLNLPLGTVKTRARKGLGLLKTIFQQ